MVEPGAIDEPLLVGAVARPGGNLVRIDGRLDLVIAGTRRLFRDREGRACAVYDRSLADHLRPHRNLRNDEGAPSAVSPELDFDERQPGTQTSSSCGNG